MWFICQALAGPSLMTLKHLHPVPLCSAMPDVSALGFPLPGVTQLNKMENSHLL